MQHRIDSGESAMQQAITGLPFAHLLLFPELICLRINCLPFCLQSLFRRCSLIQSISLAHPVHCRFRLLHVPTVSYKVIVTSTVPVLMPGSLSIPTTVLFRRILPHPSSQQLHVRISIKYIIASRQNDSQGYMPVSWRVPSARKA